MANIILMLYWAFGNNVN